MHKIILILISSRTSNKQTNNQTNSEALVRQRTIPAERPPLVGEVSANTNLTFINCRCYSQLLNFETFSVNKLKIRKVK
jgi:hypothetical protein